MPTYSHMTWYKMCLACLAVIEVTIVICPLFCSDVLGADPTCTQTGIWSIKEVLPQASALSLCRSSCAAFSANTYFGIQRNDSSSSAVRCYCGNQENQACSDICDFTCDADRPCGGATCLSVYTVCDEDKYGFNCESHCPTNCLTSVCHIQTGECIGGCIQGWYGLTCDQTCSQNCQVGECDPSTGECVGGCKKGWYRPDCTLPCPEHCREGVCEQSNGACHRGCKNGWFGSVCDAPCPANCINVTCQQSSGHCYEGCEPGWQGSDCSEDIDECEDERNSCRKMGQLCYNYVGFFVCCDSNVKFNPDTKQCDGTETWPPWMIAVIVVAAVIGSGLSSAFFHYLFRGHACAIRRHRREAKPKTLPNPNSFDVLRDQDRRYDEIRMSRMYDLDPKTPEIPESEISTLSKSHNTNLRRDPRQNTYVRNHGPVHRPDETRRAMVPSLIPPGADGLQYLSAIQLARSDDPENYPKEVFQVDDNPYLDAIRVSDSEHMSRHSQMSLGRVSELASPRTSVV